MELRKPLLPCTCKLMAPPHRQPTDRTMATPAINVVLQRFLVDIGLGGGTFHLAIDLAQQFVQVCLVDDREESQRFPGTTFAAASLQTALRSIKDAGARTADRASQSRRRWYRRLFGSCA